MDKKKIIVPKEVRYISDWKEYKLEDYNFPHILNKVLTGCGFTEYCLRNNQSVILVSPRKFLLENKEDQHPGEVYYVRNEVCQSIDYEINISEIKPRSSDKIINEDLSDTEIKEGIFKLKEGIRNYCRECGYKPKKILVTYDSFRHVKEVLTEMGIFNNFQVVIDEFQSIFIDSRFKSSTEMELLYHLRDVQRLCFVSATPMLDKYLDMLDEFKNLPYLELDWETENSNRIVHPKLDIKFTKRTLNEEVIRVIQSYLKGNFESRLDSKTGGLIESREATLFMNSVAGICQAIRSNRLHTSQCNILCARTKENEKAVRAAFNEVLRRETEELEKHPKVPKDYEVIGKIPKRGEKHKMFTFCTRTVYLGADFYSTNSRTFIFSDSNIDCLSVDIGMDLEQILGRQRLENNPWKNSANLYVKTTDSGHVFTQEELEKRLKDKIKETENLLSVYDNADISKRHSLANNFLKVACSYHYRDDYVAVNKHAGSDLKPEFNNLVLVSEIRAFEVQQIDYKDRFSVFAAVQEEGLGKYNDYVKEAFDIFTNESKVSDKLKFLVKFTTETPGITKEDINYFMSLVPEKYKEYYTLLGPDRIRANSYQESKIKQEWLKIHSGESINDNMILEIYNTFIPGNKYSKSSIKQKLKNIYETYSYSKTAKASDLEEYFIIRTSQLKEGSKWVNGFEILGKR